MKLPSDDQGQMLTRRKSMKESVVGMANLVAA